MFLLAMHFVARKHLGLGQSTIQSIKPETMIPHLPVPEGQHHGLKHILITLRFPVKNIIQYLCNPIPRLSRSPQYRYFF